MFIPHNEKKIFNFQISKFTISFFVLLFLAVVFTSSYAIIKNAKIKSEEQKLLADYKDIRSHLLRFEKQTNRIAEIVDEIKPDIEDLFIISAGGDIVDKIWGMNQAVKLLIVKPAKAQDNMYAFSKHHLAKYKPLQHVKLVRELEKYLKKNAVNAKVSSGYSRIRIVW